MRSGNTSVAGLVGLVVWMAVLSVGCGDDDGASPNLDSGMGDGGTSDGSLDATADANDAALDEDAEVPVDAGVDASDAGPERVYYGKGSGTAADSELGRSVAIDGNTLVAGAPGEQGGGAAYVFVRGENGWTQQAQLLPGSRDPMDRFGGSVAIDGDTIVVGAAGEGSNALGVDGDAADNSLVEAGAAYVFVRSGGTWTQQAYLKASNTGARDHFGYAVALSGDTVAVSAHTESSSALGIDGGDNNNAMFAGAVYVFTRDATTWSQQAYVKASNTGAFDRFGVAIDLDNDTLAVGAYHESSQSPGIDGDQDDNASPQAGAVYVYTRSGNVWTQQAYVKASNVSANDWFGGSVALEGDLLVVGAQNEDGLADEPQADSASNSGAAYVYTRENGAWSELAYLKPTVSDPGDAFGVMVAVHDGVIAVGAMTEDGAGTYPDADPLDNDDLDSGAVYLFVDSGGGYAQTHYIKATNPDEGDRFGAALTLNAVHLVVGAFSERGVGNIRDNEGAFYIYDL